MSGYIVIILHALVWRLQRIDAIQEFASQPFNSTLHSAMPDLFALDDYEHCLSRPHGYYCVLDLSLADVPGQPYDYIVEYSAVIKKHYNRALLHRGVCVSERCNLDSRGTQDPRALLSCMNHTVFRESAVQVGQVKIRYCHLADDPLPAPDALDKFFAILITILVLFVATGTLHHLLLDTGPVKGNPYLMAFSAINNWQVLKTEQTTHYSEMFPALQGIRFLTMLLIIAIHVSMILGQAFTRNPEYIEQTYDHPLWQMGANGGLFVQIFFVMSGFLLTHSFMKNTFPLPNSMGFFYKSVFDRCLRFLPTMLVAGGLSATWVPRLGSGPLWNLLVSAEREACRAGWWRNLLFVQNYNTLDKFCLLQSWYLGAATQLYALGLVLMLVLCRYQQRARLLFGTVLTVSVAVPALQTYFQKLQPVRVSFYPEAFLKSFVDNKTFMEAYMSPQANWAGYTLGMLTAYIHHQARVNRWDLRSSSVLRCLFYLSPAAALGALWFGSELHSRAASPLESAAFNVLDRNVFAAAACVFILGCISKCDRVLRGCVEWAPLQPLGRLSFCALMLHTHLLRTYVGHLPGLQHLSAYAIMLIWFGASVMTFVLSLALFLLVEQPFEQLRKLLFSCKKNHLHENKQS